MVKLLLDESVPRRLAKFFPDNFHISTVSGMGWSGIENGELLTLAAGKSFATLITADRNIEYQQNIQTLPVAVIVLIAHRTTVDNLEPLVPQVVKLIEGGFEKNVYRITA